MIVRRRHRLPVGSARRIRGRCRRRPDRRCVRAARARRQPRRGDAGRRRRDRAVRVRQLDGGAPVPRARRSSSPSCSGSSIGSDAVVPRARRQAPESGARLRVPRRRDRAVPARRPDLRRSVLGQQMLAVRANERAAAAAGINVARVKITAYAISSFIAGTAGWMYAYNFGSVSAARFGILIALGFVAFAYIGGITMVSGAVIGGLVATEGLVPYFFEELLGISGNWTLLVGGVLVIVTLIQNPEGVAGTTYRKRQAAKRAKAAASGERATPAGARDRWRRAAWSIEPEVSGDSVLSARGISVSFGGVHAVVDVDLDVEPGELVGLIGPNGAGKTTFIDAITGFVPHRGTVALDGADITGLQPARARPARSRPDVAGDRAVRRLDRTREPHRRRPPPVDADDAQGTVRPAGAPIVDAVDEALEMFALERSRRRDAERAHAGPAQARRRRPGAGGTPQVAVPRRAGRRPRRARVGRVRPPPARDRRPRHADPPRRPRHGTRARDQRPRRRARVRQGDRRRHAERCARGPEGRHGVPRLGSRPAPTDRQQR